jgi:hypothetical protein
VATPHSSIPSAHPQSRSTSRTASGLDWNTPKPRTTTPRAEWAWMRRYALICGTQPHQLTAPEVM